jgi:hypothetical protein
MHLMRLKCPLHVKVLPKMVFSGEVEMKNWLSKTKDLFREGEKGLKINFSTHKK